MFWKLFLIDLKRCIVNVKFFLTVFIGIIICYYGLTAYFDYSNNKFIDHKFINAYMAWFTAMGIGSKSFFVLLAPILATLPSSYLFLQDKQSGYLKNILFRTTYSRYFSCRIISNAISGGLAITIPAVVLYIASSSIYSTHLPDTPPNTWDFLPQGLNASIYISNPFKYMLLNFIIIFFFGATYSTIGLTTSLFVHKKISVILIPLILYTAIDMAFEFFEILNFSPHQTLFSWLTATASFSSVYGELALIFIVCLFLCIKNTIKGSNYLC